MKLLHNSSGLKAVYESVVVKTAVTGEKTSSIKRFGVLILRPHLVFIFECITIRIDRGIFTYKCVFSTLNSLDLKNSNFGL